MKLGCEDYCACLAIRLRSSMAKLFCGFQLNRGVLINPELDRLVVQLDDKVGDVADAKYTRSYSSYFAINYELLVLLITKKINFLCNFLFDFFNLPFFKSNKYCPIILKFVYFSLFLII